MSARIAPAAPPLPDDLWATIQDSIPIVCVDIVPVRCDPNGTVSEVGFIRRTSPFAGAEVWCHLGGRVLLGESVAQAVRRHLTQTLTECADVPLGTDPQPDYVMQYFREPHPDDDGRYGLDPRKHAVALTFVLEVPRQTTAVGGGEGAAFRWVRAGEVRDLQGTWPGSLTQVRNALAARHGRLTASAA